MKIFRIILLALAMALFAINFWAINYHDLWATASLWAYFRIGIAFVLVLFLLNIIRKDRMQKKSRN